MIIDPVIKFIICHYLWKNTYLTAKLTKYIKFVLNLLLQIIFLLSKFWCRILIYSFDIYLNLITFCFQFNVMNDIILSLTIASQLYFGFSKWPVIPFCIYFLFSGINFEGKYILNNHCNRKWKISTFKKTTMFW